MLYCAPYVGEVHSITVVCTWIRLDGLLIRTLTPDRECVFVLIATVCFPVVVFVAASDNKRATHFHV